jgi:hypothetical protein
VPDTGNYSLPATLDGISGYLETPQNVSVFSIPSSGAAIPIAQFGIPPATASPGVTPPATASPSSAFLATNTMRYAFGASRQCPASNHAVQSPMPESSVVSLSSSFALTSADSATNSVSASKSILDSMVSTGSEDLGCSVHFELRASFLPPYRSSRFTLSDIHVFSTGFLTSRRISESTVLEINDYTGCIEVSNIATRSIDMFSRFGWRSERMEDVTGMPESHRPDGTSFLIESHELLSILSFSSHLRLNISSWFAATDISMGSAFIEGFVTLGAGTALDVSGLVASAFAGDSGTSVESVFSEQSLHFLRTRFPYFSNDGSISSTPRSARLYGVRSHFIGSHYLGSGQMVSLLMADVSLSFEDSGMNGDLTKLATSAHSVATSVLDLSDEDQLTNLVSVSRAFGLSLQLYMSSSFLASGRRGKSKMFSLSGLDISGHSWNSDSIEVSIGLAVSQNSLASEMLPPISFMSFQFCLSESWSSLPGRIDQANLPADANRATDGTLSLGLATGLGIALFGTVLVASGSVLWFMTRRRTEIAGVTDTTEFGADFTDAQDPWDENPGMVSGENALASDVIALDVPFTPRKEVEECLWVG